MDVAGWEKMYGSGERGKEDLPTALLVEIAAALPPGNAVDLACGAGRNALYLAENGWSVAAIDASRTAIELLRQRAESRGLELASEVGDLSSPGFNLPQQAFDLVVIAYYLQRDLFPLAKAAVRPGGVVLAIVHIAEEGDPPSPKRSSLQELREIFAGWDILHAYEGPSRDPEHKRPVAELVARRSPN